MKSNKKRIDARFPNWILEWMKSIRFKYDWTFTECLIRCTEKGLAYYEKQWNKMHPAKKETEDNKPSADGNPSLSQEKNTPDDDINKEEVSDEQVDKAMEELDEYYKSKKATKTKI